MQGKQIIEVYSYSVKLIINKLEQNTGKHHTDDFQKHYVEQRSQTQKTAYCMSQ